MTTCRPNLYRDKKLAKRRSDGAIFEPSIPPGYSAGQAIAEALSGNTRFYFKRIAKVPRRWWHVVQRWEYTGEVWEPEPDAWKRKTEDEFDVVKLERNWLNAEILPDGAAIVLGCAVIAIFMVWMALRLIVIAA